MVRTIEGRRLKSNGFRSISAVKAVFRKAGHFPGTVAELQGNTDTGESHWVCECGAKLSFRKEGKKFNRLDVREQPFGT